MENKEGGAGTEKAVTAGRPKAAPLSPLFRSSLLPLFNISSSSQFLFRGQYLSPDFPLVSF